MKKFYSLKNHKIIVLIIFIFTIIALLTACSQNNVNEEVNQVQKVDLPESINVIYGTTEDEVINNYLPEKTDIVFANGDQTEVEVNWSGEESYDGTPKKLQNEGYQFTAKFVVNNNTNTHQVEVIVLDKTSQQYSSTMEFTADQKEKLVNRKDKIKLDQNQYSKIDDQLYELYNNLPDDIDKKVVGRIINNKEVDMKEITDLSQKIYQMPDHQTTNFAKQHMSLEKISENNINSTVHKLESTDNKYIFTPVNAPDDHYDYNSVYMNTNEYIPGIDITKSEAIANRYTGYVGAGNQSIGVGPLHSTGLSAVNSMALQQIIFSVPKNNTDITIKTKIYYDYGTVGVGASMGGTAELKQLSTDEMSHKWTEYPLNFEYLVDRASFILSFVVPGSDPLNIYQTLDAIGKGLDYLPIIDAFQQLDSSKQKTITYSKKSLDAGTYKFSVGLGARTSAVILGTSKAVAHGVVEKITVELEKENQPPSKPELVFPENNATEIDNNVILDWTKSNDPEGDDISYKVILGTNKNTGDIIAMNLDKTNYEVSDLDYNTTYYWRIIAEDSSGNIVSSDTFKFTTKKEIPEYLNLPARVIYPNDRLNDGEKVIKLDLNQYVDGAQQYIKVAINQTFKVQYKGYCRDLPGGAPAPIVQHFMSYSWEKWPPSDYQPLYNTVPPDSGEYFERTFDITAPLVPGRYKVWVCGGHMYSMEDTVNNHTEQPNLKPHGIIEVIK